MLKALQLIFEPSTAWLSIAEAKRGLWHVLFLYLIPVVLLGCALEAWGLAQLGNQPSTGGFSLRAAQSVATETIVRYEVVQAVLLVSAVFILSFLLRALMVSLHCKATYTVVFVTIAYSFGPICLLVAVDGLPFIDSWVCRAIGAILAAKVFYVGLVRVIKPEPTTALGVYLTGSFLIIACIGLTHFIALQVLEGGFLRSLGS